MLFGWNLRKSYWKIGVNEIIQSKLLSSIIPREIPYIQERDDIFLVSWDFKNGRF